MAITVFEGYTVGPVERGIPLPEMTEKVHSSEQTSLLRLQYGESFDVMLRVGGPTRRDISRLLAWARRKGIDAIQHDIDPGTVRIERIYVDAKHAG